MGRGRGSCKHFDKMKEERTAWRLKLQNKMKLVCFPRDCGMEPAGHGALEDPRKGLLCCEHYSQTFLMAEWRVDVGRGGASACVARKTAGGSGSSPVER